MSERTGLEIAIVGLAGRFPGARDVAELWRNLLDGVESIVRLTDEELAAAGVPAAALADPRYVKAGTVLDGADLLDAEFFGFTPRDTEVIDPQHRLFLECAWEALESAGYAPGTDRRPVGVYAGVSFSTYALLNVWSRQGRLDSLGGLLGADKDHLPTLVSWKLDLEGPSLAVQTACSTSLVAVHLAAQSLLNGECDMALAGGASIRFPQHLGYLWSEGGLHSPDGHCRTFDAGARGTVFGHGVGIVVLKRLEDALEDGDTIHAVLKGSAVNNDGAGRMAYTAPRLAGQVRVVRAAQRLAEVEPESIGYVEAHGTGTALGDPIEVAALTEAFRAGTDRRGYCALGSIKPNVGHLNAAAGVAGLIKAVLALEHRTIPPTLHFERPNPEIDFASSPFFVNAEPLPWEADGGPRRAAVSSFGMGGTNAHAILEEAPEPEPTTASRPLQMLVLSARTPAALEAATARLAAHLEAHPEEDLADVAHTLHVGRRAFAHRRAALAASREEALRALTGGDPGRVLTGRAEDRERPVHFLFPGQGAQHAGMTRGLYEAEPAFREEIDRCAALLRPALGFDLRDVLYPAAGREAEAAERLARTAVTQPALFAVEYALAKLWMSWGVRPQGMIGHSLGEYVAACLAGVFTLEAALELVALRGRLMQELPGGAMLAVPLPPERLEPLLGDRLSLAAVNGPEMCVVSGGHDDVERLRREIEPLLAEGLESRPLHTSHAFHSAAMDPILAAFADAVRRAGPRPPSLPFVSNVTGGWITPAEAVDPGYWARHLRQAVLFSRGLATLAAAAPDAALLEVGPGRTLSTLARRHPAWAGRSVVASARHPQDEEGDPEALLRALGQLWLAGAAVDWRGFYAGERRRRLPLPTYPFERRRYFLDPPAALPLAAMRPEPEGQEERDEPAAAAVPEAAYHPRPGLSTPYVAPSTETERVLAGLWRDLFGIAEIGVHDDFFDLGGHSLLVTRLASRAREALGVELPLRAFFAERTVSRLAAAVEAQRAAHGAGTAPPLVPVPRDGDLPLSFGQERLWFLDRLDPGSTAYNVAAVLRLQGDLDLRALAATLDEVVRRHETLRTTFAVEDRGPVQVLHPPGPFALALADVSALPEGEREAVAQRLVETDLRRPFDLAAGPLVRATLVRLAEREHRLVFAMHHIVSDGWSLGVLVREVGALYPSAVRGEASPLAPLSIQYADYAAWQRRWMQGEALAEHLAWWRGHLAGAPALLGLPTDRPRPAVQRFRGARVDAWLPEEAVAPLRRLGQGEGATLFMSLLAAFSVLLQRHSGQDDLVVGSPSANRDRAGLEELIGFFVNTLVTRVELAGDPAFPELLVRARDAALGSQSHQALPFEKLVEELQPERSLSHSPIFQVMLALQNAPGGTLDLPGLTLRPEARPQEVSKFDLTLTVAESGAGLVCQWRYDTELFDESTVAALAGRFRALLAALADAPERRISELPLLAPEERQQLLHDWSRGEAAPVGARSLYGIVAAQAAARPDAPALLFEGGDMTYAELAARAERLGRHLRRLGVGPEVRVGLFAERSPEMVVGLLAVSAAGGAYVPLDPGYPQERLAWLLADSAAAVILAQKALLESLPEHSAAIVPLDEEPAASGAALPDTVDPDQLAYVIYTSGSTGAPKGVLVSHSGVENLAAAQAELFAVGPEGRLLQFASISFDASVSEIAVAFWAGAALGLASRRALLPGPDLVDLLRRWEISVVTLPPTALAALPEAELPALRTLVVAGEACPPELARRWGAGRRLVNAYGPTETTVCATAWIYDGGDRLPVGRPIAGTEVFVVDPSGQPAPRGVVGELWVGGVGLARGYHGRPDLTAERFVPHPFSELPGARLYRTGDLARFLTGGELELRGRIDHQVKIRGVRVEPGEVESALLALPGVREAVAVARTDGAGPARLVAYAVPAEGSALDGGALREALAAVLPEGLVPAAVAVLPSFPLTPNGKVDRKALPAPERVGSAAVSVAPRNDLERFLAGLWQETLGVASIGVDDDFFALGGNSITGAMFVNRLQRELREIVHVVVMFDAPTVAKLAAYLTEQYPKAVARLFGEEVLGGRRSEKAAARVDPARVEAFRALIPPAPAVTEDGLPKNPPAAFILSPPRSGSTLLRVMLAGHPRLFAPPELELLSFATLAERRAAFPGRNAFWLEGVTRAVMELRGCGAEEAEALLAELEAEGTTTRELYRRVQEWIGADRLLVDKTPSYALELEVLRRAEATFEGARYVHLLRHPYGMIRSFEEAKLDQVFFRHPHALARRELAELIWLTSQRNILEFLRGVPLERQYRVRFEDLVADPEGELRGICDFLGIDYHPAMAAPYEKKERRMTDGIHAWSRMLGDVKFHEHSGVDRSTADRWRDELTEDFLGDVTWEAAEGLGYFRERRDGEASAALAPVPRAPGEPLPVSFGQQRLWFLDRLDPESSAYNVSMALRMSGDLDRPALEAALDEIVRRHEMLRTTFAEDGREPVQVIHPPRPFGLEWVDLSDLDEAEREGAARELALTDQRRPFDLARGPLARGTLARLSPREHLVLFSLHHIAADGWSVGILVREVVALYRAFLARETSPLPELPLQYADYAVWQRRWLRGAALDAEVGWWRERLAGAPPLLALPTDRPRPAVQRFQGARVESALDAGTTAALRRLGQRQGATLFMTLLAAFAALLQRHAGGDEVVVGTPIAGRHRPELEGLIGFFVNTLALPVDLAGDPAFPELLARARHAALGAYAHQHLPFEKLVEELQPERSLAHSPVVQVMLVLQNQPESTLELPGLTLRAEGRPQEVSKFDLTLNVTEAGGRLFCQWRYNTELFDAATMERRAGHFANLVAALAADPVRRLSDLPLLGEAERRQLLEEWSRGGAAPVGARSLYGIVAAQAAARPDAPALLFEDGAMTYAELAARAERLGRHLRRLGVGPEVRVGLFAERSPEMVVGLLAVLAAGGAYLPLDPGYPRERLAWLLADSGVVVILAQGALLEALPEHPATTVLLDGEPGEAGAALPGGVDPDQLAYVIYTSGSTGTPKGVLVSHRGVENLAAAQAELFAVGPESRLLQFASISFDASVSEIAVTFRAGAALALASRRALLPGPDLVDLLRRWEISVVTLPPTALAALPEAELPALRTLVVAGEACPPELARRWGAGRRLVNAYGPTETTVCATAWIYDGGDRLPVGRPIANAEVYVVDPSGQPTPQGVPGELWVGGAGLARGYHGRPDLTAERFVPHPFAGAPGARLYRTGDLARFLPGGALELLGRTDDQVKIRGVRVEPGEVESALLALPGVRQAVAVARTDGAGPARLVAYAVPAEGAALDGGALRETLASLLPEGLVPSVVVVLPSLPLTPNGKVDRKALPAPERTGEAAGRVAPRNDLERFLAGVWQEMLGVAEVGAHDDFFAMGGNSITGAMFVNRLQQEVGEIVHVVVMFDAPTVAKLAAYLGEHYPEAVERRWGAESLAAPRRQGAAEPIDEARIEAFRALIPPAPAVTEDGLPKNPPAAFILSPPRSGSTLLRVMLAGHPGLFAPPELELLSFATLAERREAFPGRNAFWLEGVTRAVMELRGCGAEEADALLAELEAKGTTTRELYRLLQEWIGDRLLVDKTPSYALDLGVLRRAEETFADARYVHLLRHPHGMIRSFEEAKLEQVFFRHPHALGRRELAELIWLVSQRNILAFLAEVPAERQHRIRFEDLVADPERELRGICAFLGLEYHPAMAAPYETKERRMTDGIHAWSRMLGDVKFHQYRGVDRSTADRWREELAEDFLGRPTWRMAEDLGYPAPAEEGSPSWTPIAARPVEPGRPYPLSFAQERLWVLDRMDPGSPAYNIPVGVRLEGRLDVAALGRSLSEIVRRHAVLRSVLAEEGGRPVQVPRPAVPVPLPLVDLAALSTEAREAEARRLARAFARRPFDLARGPLLRAALVRLGAEEHGAFFTLHHAAGDGWSMGVLIRELSALYTAYSQGLPSPLPELSIQYADYARWQRERLTGPVLEAQLDHWRRALAGVPVLQLPTDRPRPPVQTFSGAVRSFALDAGTARGLRELGRRSGGTLFMTLLAGFAALLHRYSGQDDVAIGSPSANRPSPQLEELIGFFVNTVVLRADLSGAPGFAELLGRVRAVARDAYAHQEVPFEKVVFELQPERNLATSPLFQVMFAMQNAPRETLSLPGLELKPMPMQIGTAKFDLTLNAVEGGEGLAGALEYNTDLFDGATIDRMLGHFRELLAGVVAAPARPVGEVPILQAAEREQLTAEWNGTEREVPAGCVHEWIAARAILTPDAVALTAGGAALTYGELEGRANGLAHELRRLGVGPESRVGIALERSLELVVSLLAVWKAGGAYVPLDPSYPAERLAFMREDAGLALVLTAETLPEAAAASEPPAGGAGTEHAAYVIYTSGSTGKPKGVQIPHGALANFLASMAETPGFGPEDRLLAVTSLSFDIAGLELWLPLVVGGRVVLATREEAADGARLQVLLAESGATVLQATPATWRLLLESSWEGTPGLKALCGGESLPPALAAALLPRVGSLWNVYGPTETTIWSTVEEIRGGGPIRPITIGRPIANTQAYVLDEAGGLAPVGVPGELLLGGAGLARGYLGRPDLTAERFVPDPFGGTGSRLYRTGDLARWRPDGALECQGRIDHQVKVRGFRIELGEVEAALGRLPAVAVAAATAREDRLTAFAVPAGEARPSLSEVRGTLASTLPDYMLPSALVWLEELPLTPNGKVDRKALPVPEGIDRTAEARVFAAPRTPVEEVVAGIWAEVLRRDGVGLDDSFFDLGGHSLLATRVLSRVREAFGVELPLRRLFEAPTVAGLARAVEAALQAGSGLEAPPLVPVPRTGNLPLSFGQQRLWILDQLDPGSTAYNMPVALRLEGELDAAALARTLDEVARRHEVLRTTFAVTGREPVQVIHAPGPFALSLVDLSHVSGGPRDAAARALVQEDLRRPFDLARGPLARATLVRLAEREHLLLLAMHHAVSDGWSMGVLVREVGTLYPAFAAGVAPALPQLPIQYADYAAWQRSWLQGESLDRHLAWWRDHLAGAPAFLNLPTDRPRPAMQSYRGSRVDARLAPEDAAALRRLAQRQGSTLFMSLLALFATLLQRHSGQDDLVVGTPTANRDRAELEGLIGFFANTLALRVDLAGDPAFPELLARVRESALGAYAHQEMPFEKLVEELQPERSLAHSPLFQVMLALQNAPGGSLDLPGLTLRPESRVQEVAKFDLTLNVAEAGEGLGCSLEYATDLFDRATVVRLLGHFRELLAGLVAAPDRALSELPVLSSGERQQLLREWNDAAEDWPVEEAEACLHELIARRAARTPDALAVTCEGSEPLTYAALITRAEAWAGHLRALGVGPETLVGVAAERSPEMVVGLLAVLLAGGAYVPVDPSHPRERQAYVLADSGVGVLLTQERLLASLPLPSEGEDGPRVLCLDGEVPSNPADTAPLVPRATPDAAAYAIYTSGSTGRPKGAVNTHRAIVNRLLWMQRAYGLGADDRVLQKTPFSFDVSVWELFWPLLTGARLAMAAPGGHQDPAYLARRIAEEGITTLHFVPSMLQAFLEEPSVSGLTSLRRVIASGEALPPALVDRFFARMPAGVELHNLYGPTEAAVDVTYEPCRPDRGGAPVAIGRPVANTRIHLLDRTFRPVPVGVTGELHIGGVQVGRGYLGRPELTAERFVPDPCSGEPGARLYRTGDLARHLPDGRVEYLGRVDFQVKIRGVRIELGEVEAALGRLPGVRESVVVVRDSPVGPRLVAYLVPEADAEPPAPGALREALLAELPEPMVPSLFVALAALPLSANGKVDRKALPEPEGGRPALAAAYVAPRDPVEELLAGIWAEVLRLPRVGVLDNFFTLGGHSLLATQVVSRVGEALEIDVPLRRLFEAPTVAGLAEALRRAATSPEELTRAAALVLELMAMSDDEVEALLSRQAVAGSLEEV